MRGSKVLLQLPGKNKLTEFKICFYFNCIFYNKINLICHYKMNTTLSFNDYMIITSILECSLSCIFQISYQPFKIECLHNNPSRL
jgi:hypothetical protein